MSHPRRPLDCFIYFKIYIDDDDDDDDDDNESFEEVIII